MISGFFKNLFFLALATVAGASCCFALDNLEPSIELDRAGDSSSFLLELPSSCQGLATELLQICCPNENSHGVISYSLASPQKVGLSIYDQQGREVVHLVDNTIASGHHRTMWDGCEKNGDVVANGTYFLLMKTQDSVNLRRLVLDR